MDLGLLKSLAEGQKPLALATIVEVKGSSPRHAGSKMTLDATQQQKGTVGGGRGEAMALQACAATLEDGKARILKVDMTGQEVLGNDMICGGANTMLIEPVQDGALYGAALDRLAKGERIVFLKRILLETGTVETTLLSEQGQPIQGAQGSWDPELLAKAVKTGRPVYAEGENQLYDPIFPVERLLILGGGHVGQALASLANRLDFAVTIADDRPEFADAERFPQGVQTQTGSYAEILERYPFDASTYVVVVTKGHLHDLQCVRSAIQKTCRYLGFIGSARKSRMLIQQLREDGHDPQRIDSMFGPIGLDIAAETPEELAVAILGELIAVRRHADLQGMSLARKGRA